MTEKTRLAATKLVSLALFCGPAGERIHELVAAALEWAEADQAVILAQFAGSMATRSGDRPDLVVRDAERKEKAALHTLLTRIRELHAWSEETP